MKKITFKKTSFIALGCLVFLTNNLFSQTQNYFGTSGTFSGSVWSTDPSGPYTSALDATNGAVINFGNTATTGVTGANITVAGINATQNATINTIGGTISNYNNGVISINVSDNMTFDASSQVFTTQATAGYIKNGNGVFATSGNTYGGGFTLNAGTLIARGNNALGAGALTINGGTIAPITSAKDFSSKFSSITIGGDFTLGATTGLATSAAALTFNTATSFGSATRKITLGGTGAYTWSGVISGDAGVGLTVEATAAGSLKLSGANTYTGTTTINSGTLKLGSSSALGTVDGGTIINSTSNTTGGILDLAGFNYSTAEPLTLNGNGIGGGAIVNSSTSDGTFAGPITLGSASVVAGGAGLVYLTNTINGTGALTIGGGTGGVVSGVMSMTGSLLTSGNWTISGANTYTGSTSITTSGRTLTLGASEVIPNGSAVILNNATLKTGATTGFSETAGTLQLSTNSATIALGTGVHSLTFADSHSVAWTAAKTLTIIGWTGSPSEGGTDGKIFVGTDNTGLTPTQLAQITFTGYSAGAALLSNGELIPNDLATALENTELQKVNVSINQDGALTIFGLQTTAMLNVYNTNGLLVVSKMIQPSDAPIILNQKGLYIVKLNDKVYKLIK